MNGDGSPRGLASLGAIAQGAILPGEEMRHDSYSARLVAPLLIGSLLNPINSTMISTALVPIGRDFHAGVAATAWLIAALYLASAVAQPAMGRIGDLVGPRRVLLAGLVAVAAAGVAGCCCSRSRRSPRSLRATRCATRARSWTCGCSPPTAR